MTEVERLRGSLQEALASHRFSDIADICDDLELQLAAVGAEKPDDRLYLIHLLGHIYISDLNSARFLWKRIPETVKQSQPELLAIWKIGQCMWKYDYSGVHEALCSYSWSPEVQAIVSSLSEDYRKRMLRLISTAYSTIGIGEAARLLGMTEEEAVHCTTFQGWTLDATTRMLTVKPLPPVVEQNGDSGSLQMLSEYVFHLEH